MVSLTVNVTQPRVNRKEKFSEGLFEQVRSGSFGSSVRNGLDYINWGRKPHPLLLVPFPRQKSVGILRAENGLSTSVAVCTLCSLLWTVGTRPLCSLSPDSLPGTMTQTPRPGSSPITPRDCYTLLGWAVAWDCELKHSCSRLCGLSQRMEWDL